MIHMSDCFNSCVDFHPSTTSQYCNSYSHYHNSIMVNIKEVMLVLSLFVVSSHEGVLNLLNLKQELHHNVDSPSKHLSPISNTVSTPHAKSDEPFRLLLSPSQFLSSGTPQELITANSNHLHHLAISVFKNMTHPANVRTFMHLVKESKMHNKGEIIRLTMHFMNPENQNVEGVINTLKTLDSLTVFDVTGILFLYFKALEPQIIGHEYDRFLKYVSESDLKELVRILFDIFKETNTRDLMWLIEKLDYEKKEVEKGTEILLHGDGTKLMTELKEMNEKNLRDKVEKVVLDYQKIAIFEKISNKIPALTESFKKTAIHFLDMFIDDIKNETADVDPKEVINSLSSIIKYLTSVTSTVLEYIEVNEIGENAEQAVSDMKQLDHRGAKEALENVLKMLPSIDHFKDLIKSDNILLKKLDKTKIEEVWTNVNKTEIPETVVDFLVDTFLFVVKKINPKMVRSVMEFLARESKIDSNTYKAVRLISFNIFKSYTKKYPHIIDLNASNWSELKKNVNKSINDIDSQAVEKFVDEALLDLKRLNPTIVTDIFVDANSVVKDVLFDNFPQKVFEDPSKILDSVNKTTFTDIVYLFLDSMKIINETSYYSRCKDFANLASDNLQEKVNNATEWVKNQFLLVENGPEARNKLKVDEITDFVGDFFKTNNLKTFCADTFSVLRINKVFNNEARQEVVDTMWLAFLKLKKEAFNESYQEALSDAQEALQALLRALANSNKYRPDDFRAAAVKLAVRGVNDYARKNKSDGKPFTESEENSKGFLKDDVKSEVKLRLQARSEEKKSDSESVTSTSQKPVAVIEELTSVLGVAALSTATSTTPSDPGLILTITPTPSPSVVMGSTKNVIIASSTPITTTATLTTSAVSDEIMANYSSNTTPISDNLRKAMKIAALRSKEVTFSHTQTVDDNVSSSTPAPTAYSIFEGSITTPIPDKIRKAIKIAALRAKASVQNDDMDVTSTVPYSVSTVRPGASATTISLSENVRKAMKIAALRSREKTTEGKQEELTKSDLNNENQQVEKSFQEMKEESAGVKGLHLDHECTRNAQELVEFVLASNYADKDWAAKMLDSWIQTPYAPNTFYLAKRRQCISIQHPSKRFSGQFCNATIRISLSFTDHYKPLASLFRNQEMPNSFGVCIPSTCTAQEFNSILQGLVASNKSSLNGLMDLHIIDSTCYVKQDRISDWERVPRTIIYVLFALVLLSTAYELRQRVFLKDDKPSIGLSMFSLHWNAQQLFGPKEEWYPPVDGLKSLGLAWFILHSTYASVSSAKLLNDSDGGLFLKDARYMFPMDLTGATDVLLLVAAFLTARSFVRAMYLQGHYDFALATIKRYFRLAPCVGAMIVLRNGILMNKDVEGDKTTCDSVWLYHLLFVQNFMDYDNLCLPQGWYLSVEMQLYLLSPVVLYGLFYLKKFRWLLCVVLLTSCTALTLFLLLNLDEKIDLFPASKSQQFDKDLSKPYTRAVPWLVGLIMGFFLYRQQEYGYQVKLRKWHWLAILAGAIALSGICIFGAASLLEGNPTKWRIPTYLVLSRVGLSFSLASIIFVCADGCGGWIATLLSADIFRVLSRLSFCALLMHSAVIDMRMRHTTIAYVDDYMLILHFVADYVVANILAVPLCLLVELPTANLKKCLLRDLQLYPWRRSPSKTC